MVKHDPAVISAIAQEVIRDGYAGIEGPGSTRVWGHLGSEETLNMERTVERVLHHFEKEMARVPK